MPRSLRNGPRRGASGQVLVLFAMILVVLLMVSALAIDYGAWLVARRSYQNFSDAASLAGAQLLTRPLTDTCLRSDGTTVSKNECAREAAWASVKKALGLTTLDPEAQAAGPSFSTPYQENDYQIWVASPPSDAGAAFLGHVSGPGVVYVRIEHEQPSYFSRIAGISRTVTSWATAGRFPANFAVIGMCRPAAGDHCLAPGGDTNIKIDGNNAILAV
ncbi:MAG TPA: TadE/TadG family type IV pilus assembly protein, partial [Candidatus Limnocylindrales bacterium]|nr:TadE/TadG family type IV pilus assembly protein [Candidatus Limnocylindrales bacterium]